MPANNSNPLTEYNGMPPFSEVKPEHVVPAVKAAIEKCRTVIANVCEKYAEDPTWDNVVAPIEEVSDRLSKVWSVVSHLNSVNNTPELRQVHDECLPLLSEFSAWSGQYRPYFNVLKKIESSDAFGRLSIPQRKAIENSLRDFRLSGIDLSPEDQKEYVKISTRLSELSSKFSNNVLDATHGYVLEVKDENRLKGLPENSLKLAKSEAEKRNFDGYVFTLEMPSYLPFLTYCEDRELREEIYRAFNTRSSDIGPNAGKWDNLPLIDEILELRHKEAELLGFKSYAHLSLATKMADSPETVISFLRDLAKKSRKQGIEEVKELEDYAKSQGLSKLEPWDMAFYSEKLRQERYSYSEEELRPYFPEDQVIEGMFECARRLYGISLKQRYGVDLWNDSVKCFDVYEEKFGSRIGSLFMDLYARPGKNGGAWMDECLTRRYRDDGALQLPVAYLVCNFTRPVSGDVSELTHDEVVTMFHEFGHTLNQLLTKIDISDVSGINGVPWDAVELPSQFNENFAWSKEALKFLSRHVKTGESLPDDKLKAVLDAKNFESAMAMLRQIEFALFDFRLHYEYNPKQKVKVYDLLDEVKKEVSVVPQFKDSRFPNNFTHIFSGGYAAGYYSYKWAEVLAADAFSLFEENGIFDRETGQNFADLILSCGGASDPMKNFEEFRGRKPSVDAL
ncbi:MAG: oligopeptidase A, partial [Succinivibrio sp.]